MLLLALVVIGTPIVVFILFSQWADSVQRQIAGLLALFGIGWLATLRRKYHILLLGLIFLSQFQVSLVTFDLRAPAALQIYLTDIILALFVFAGLERGERLRPDRLGWLLIAFIGWGALVTLVASAHASQSLMYLLWLLKCLGVYLLVLNMQLTGKFLRQIKLAIVLVVMVQAGLALAQQMTGGSLGLAVFGEPERLHFVLGGLRMSGTLGATNAFAGYMAMLLVFCMPFLFQRQKLPFYVLFSLGLITLVLALSRAGWLSFVLGSLVVMVGLFRAGLVQFTRFIAIGLLAAVVAGGAIVTYMDRIQDRFQSDVAVSSAEGRVAQFTAFRPVVERYRLFGIGPGITEFYGAWNNKAKYLQESLPNLQLGNQPHNSLLQFAIEGGLMWAAIFAAILAMVIGTAFRRVPRNRRLREVSVFRIAASAAALAAMIHASFGTEINNYQIGIVFWALLALARNRSYQSMQRSVMAQPAERIAQEPEESVAS